MDARTGFDGSLVFALDLSHGEYMKLAEALRGRIEARNRELYLLPY